MPRPSTFSFALIVVLGSCSKSADLAPHNAAGPVDEPQQFANAPKSGGTGDAVHLSAAAPEQPAQKAATDVAPKAGEKPRPNTAQDEAKRARSTTARRWNAFQATIKKCVAVPITEREQCLAGARDRYRSAKFNCTALPGRDRDECVKYAKLWKDTKIDAPSATMMQDEDPAENSASPDAESAAESNPDSTRQSRDAGAPSPAETRPN
jgi:hypothetical protein